MTIKPISFLNWTDGDPLKIAQPPSPILLRGWAKKEAPPFDWMNWLFYTTDLWLKYFDAAITSGEPDQVLRLINGGEWKFNKTTGVLSWSAEANMSITGVPDSNNAMAAGSVTLADGQIAYVNINTPIIANGDSTNLSNILTNMNFTGNLAIGMTVTGPGIPVSTTITGVGSNSVTLNNSATSSNVGATYVFSNTTALTPAVANASSFIPTLSTIMFSKRVGDVVYWGVNTSQMTLLDGEFKKILRSGYFDTYEQVAGEILTAGKAVYVSSGNPTDPGRIAGRIYKLDVSATFQSIRGIFAGIVISDFNPGDTATVLFSGFYKFISLTSGLTYFADPANPGDFTSIEPSGAGEKIIQIGFATTSTNLLVNATQNSNGAFVKPIFGAEILGYGPGAVFSLSTAPFDQDSVFLFVNDLILPKDQWSIIGPNITLGTAANPGDKVYAQYIKAQQSYLEGNQQIPTGVIDGVNVDFLIDGQPSNQASVMVFINKLIVSQDQYSLSYVGGSQAKITFNVAPPLASDIYISFLTPVGTGGINTIANIGLGAGLFAGLVGQQAQFKTIVAGANTTISEFIDHIVISSSVISYAQESFAGNGSTVLFTIANTPVADAAVLVFEGGLALTQGLSQDYTIVGSAITFNTAPVPGAKILVKYNY